MTHPAHRCPMCGHVPQFRLERRGDAVVSWACAGHLADECVNLQRDWETTEIVVRLARLEYS
jgi:hypothetical protein